MNEEDKTRRIQQMCNFIIQEAKEKVNEIKLKTENDFALEKQMLVHNNKLKLQQDFKQFEKNIETQKRVAHAKTESSSRTKLMFEREKIVQTVKEKALHELVAFVSNTKNAEKYKEVLKLLILQGLIKLNEKNIKVLCRKEDVQLVEAVKDAAAAEYKELINKATKEDVSVNLTVEASDKCRNGGVKLVAHGNKLVCDNSLESRIEISFQTMMPELRRTLFTTKV